ncbi:MAG: alpha/beta hydrolase family protein [Pseudonocardiaceae bacterium]
MSTPGQLYPSRGLVVDERHDIELFDADRIGQPGRAIPCTVRWSSSAAVPMPVVVLSHGGAEGKTNPRLAMVEWAEALAEHGYLSVSIAHIPRSDIERIVLTMNLRGTLPQCAEFKYLGYDRPLDFTRVIDELVANSANPPWSGQADTTRVGYMGHSAGAGSAMMVAGAGREYLPGLGLSFAEHALPRAFVAMSPQGAGEDGFQPDSWDGVARPMLMCTGASDGDFPHERRDPYEYMQPGDKHLLWIDHPGAEHTVFAGGTDACIRTTADKPLCDSMQDWLASAVLAFFDAHLRGDQAGIDYLASDALAQVSSGLVELTTK